MFDKEEYQKNREKGLRGQGPALKAVIYTPSVTEPDNREIRRKKAKPEPNHNFTRKGFKGHKKNNKPLTLLYPSHLTNKTRMLIRRMNRLPIEET